jgi:alanine-glyoxylate transaminase/serine-glyoxylate transaminase/serine-pyruvate transaminase
VPEGYSADVLRATILSQSSVSLGNGLGRLADRVFRIGHLGDFNDAAVLGTLAAIEAGLTSAAVPIRSGGVMAAIDSLSGRNAMAAAAE